jgi:hypothetical protein
MKPPSATVRFSILKPQSDIWIQKQLRISVGASASRELQLDKRLRRGPLSWWAARVFSFTVKMEKSWAKMASLLEI